MSDIIDDGNETAELFLQAALLNQQRKVTATPTGIGLCLNCSAEVEGERRWCDHECMVDWEQDQRRHQFKKTHGF